MFLSLEGERGCSLFSRSLSHHIFLSLEGRGLKERVALLMTFY
jgi:hypothetical protein